MRVPRALARRTTLSSRDIALTVPERVLHHAGATQAVQRSGLATFLNVEAIRYLQTSGMGLVEVQTMQQNTAARGLYEKLGFEQVDQGIVLRKS